MFLSRTLARTASLTAVLLCLSLATSMPAADWSGFRGPHAAGISSDTRIPLEWSNQKNLKWRLELPGAGFSSPIVVGDRVLVTCYSEPDDNPAKMVRHLVSVDRQTGKIIWSKAVASAATEPTAPGFATAHGYASETPVSDGERIYVVFGNTGAMAFDLEGKQLWHKEIGKANQSMYGSACSPILYKDRVIIIAGSQSESLLALDRLTGKEVWNTEAPSLTRCYSTPVVVKNADGVDELLISAPEEVWSVNPANGGLNWYAETGIDMNSCPSPVVQDNIMYVIGGRRGARAAVRIGGEDDTTKSNVVWQMPGGSYVPSPVLYKDHLYFVDHQGIANCVDLKTGQQVAKQRLGGQFYASVVLIDGKLFAVSRFSGTHVLEASPELKQLAHNKLTDESDFSASPAVSDGQLFLRSDKYLYCIEASK